MYISIFLKYFSTSKEKDNRSINAPVILYGTHNNAHLFPLRITYLYVKKNPFFYRRSVPPVRLAWPDRPYPPARSFCRPGVRVFVSQKLSANVRSRIIRSDWCYTYTTHARVPGIWQDFSAGLGKKLGCHERKFRTKLLFCTILLNF
jgi:hypothetical protein